MSKKKITPTFETDLHRLTEIVESMEASEIPLDVAIALYKEGLALAAKCGQTLTNYESEILTLQKEADGSFSTAPFAEVS